MRAFHRVAICSQQTIGIRPTGVSEIAIGHRLRDRNFPAGLGNGMIKQGKQLVCVPDIDCATGRLCARRAVRGPAGSRQR